MAAWNFVPPVSPANAADDGGTGPVPGVPKAGGMDPTLVSGQDPDSVAGIPMPYSTGAGAGSDAPGGEGQGAHAVNQPNQYPGTEPISGVTLEPGTGLPGSQGAPQDQLEDPGEMFWVTDPNYMAGKPGGGSGNQMLQVPVKLGTDDSTTVAGQYPPAAPLPAGNFYAVSTGAGDGHVMVGGWKKGQRG